MFRKNRTTRADAKATPMVRITTMPDVFYGGQDPMIYHQSSNDRADQSAKPARKQISLSFLFSRRLMVIGASVVFIIVVAGVSWYYIRQARPKLASAVPAVLPPATTQLEAEPASSLPATTTADIQPGVPGAPTTTPSLGPPTLLLPTILLADSPDLDADELTDREEELFRTDSGRWDTDGDGYYDGQEVLNLYNPTSQAPVRLIDSGLIREYVNPRWQYRLYYPVVWEKAEVDSGANQVIFSSVTGDYIGAQAFEKESAEAFADWFARAVQGESYGDLTALLNRFDVSGFVRRDNLAAYFITPTAVFVLSYHPPSGAAAIPYRNLLRMMFQSFRPGAVPAQLPAQPPLPPAPTTSVSVLPID